MEWEWENLDEATYRAKVIGGWMLLHTKHTTFLGGKKKDMIQSESMVFLPDRDHEWTIVKRVAEKEKLPTKSIAEDFEAK